MTGSTSSTPSPGQAARPGKNERRDAAREQARILREKQMKRDKRNKVIAITVFGVAVLALLGVGAYIFSQRAQTASLPEYDDIPLSEVTSAPSAALDGGGFAFSADGIGDVDDTLPRVDVYLDYMCPACGSFEATNGENLVDLAAGGELTVVYHPIAILNRFSQGSGYSTRSAAAGVLIAEEAPDAFQAFTQQMFASQPAEGTPGLSDTEIADIARDAGVPDAVADRIADGTALDDFGQWVTSATNEVSADADLVNPQSGNFGTPTITIDGTFWGGDWTDPANLLAAIG